MKLKLMIVGLMLTFSAAAFAGPADQLAKVVTASQEASMVEALRKASPGTLGASSELLSLINSSSSYSSLMSAVASRNLTKDLDSVVAKFFNGKAIDAATVQSVVASVVVAKSGAVESGSTSTAVNKALNKIEDSSIRKDVESKASDLSNNLIKLGKSEAEVKTLVLRFIGREATFVQLTGRSFAKAGGCTINDKEAAERYLVYHDMAFRNLTKNSVKGQFQGSLADIHCATMKEFQPTLASAARTEAIQKFIDSCNFFEGNASEIANAAACKN